MGADLHDLVSALFTPPGNPYFAAIEWDAHRHCLSFQGHDGRYVNVWLNRPAHNPKLPQMLEHFVETNGGSAADSEVIWRDGEWTSEPEETPHGFRRTFIATVPPDVAENRP